jgi:hypothetical protein
LSLKARLDASSAAANAAASVAAADDSDAAVAAAAAGAPRRAGKVRKECIQSECLATKAKQSRQ